MLWIMLAAALDRLPWRRRRRDARAVPRTQQHIWDDDHASPTLCLSCLTPRSRKTECERCAGGFFRRLAVPP